MGRRLKPRPLRPEEIRHAARRHARRRSTGDRLVAYHVTDDHVLIVPDELHELIPRAAIRELVQIRRGLTCSCCGRTV